MSKSVRAIGLAIFLLSSVARADEAPEPPPAGPPAGTVMSQPALGSELRISRDDAIRLALENNLNLIIARTGPELAQQQVERAGGAFDPQLYLDHEFADNETPIFNPFQVALGGGTSIKDKQWLYSGGVAGLVPAGVTYTSSYNVRRLETSSAFSALLPEWRGDWESELTIPVLKNLFSNPASVTVERSEIGLDISVEDFREDLMDEVRTVEFAYWELGAARAEEGVAQKSLQTARDLLEQTRVRYEVGVVSKVLVTQAEAGVAEREVTAIVALNRAEGAEDALLDLIAAPTMEEFESTRLVVDDPTFVDYTVEPDVIIRRAMRLRPEIQIARKQVEDAEIQLRLATNQLLPSLDLVASYRLSGLAGKSTGRTDFLTGDPIVSPFPKHSSGVTDDWFSASQNRSWVIGARFELPLGNDVARAELAQRKIELRRAFTSMRRVEQDIILDVRDAARVLRNSADSVAASERRRVASQETLRAEEERLRLGDSTPFLVLEFEEDLTESESQVIQSLQAYRNAITAIERSQATLLETRSISLVRELQRR